VINQPTFKTSLGSKVPWIIHKLIEWMAEYVKGDETFAEIFGESIKLLFKVMGY
jgi:hypothetical protein